MVHRTQKDDHLRWRDTFVVKCGKMRRDGTSALFAGIRDRSTLAAASCFNDLDLNARALTKARINLLVHCTMRLKRKEATPKEFRAREDGFHEGEHIAMASEIIGQRKCLEILVSLLLRAAVIEEHFHICPAKAIERLLRIAYRHHVRAVLA